MLRYLLFCQGAIFLASFEKIVCPLVDFPVKNFGSADIYNKVMIEGDAETGQFIFRKRATKDDERNIVVPFCDIIPTTYRLEGRRKNIVSFSTRAAHNANYNIKFKHDSEAKNYINNKRLPPSGNLHWGRIFSNWRPARITSQDLDDGDVGLEIFDGKDPQVSYHLKRSELDNAFWLPYPNRLYLRDNSRMEDYFVHFYNEDDKNAFTNLFPNATFNEPGTEEYYFMP